MREDIERRFSEACERYAELGVDVLKALSEIEQVSLSMHCWQGDDVGGFEAPDSELAGGGIAVTGNYPGRARDIDELRADAEKAFSLIPGSHRFNLHAIYGDFKGQRIERNMIEPEHFESWIEWAKELEIGLDFNSTLFSHPMADSGFTLSSMDEGVRKFWIEHVEACRNIGAYMGQVLETPCVHNIWIPDGSKDNTLLRLRHREHLRDSLDIIFGRDYPDEHLKDAVESKLFGIGSESFVVGSHDFYLAYALANGRMLCMDMGHYHPTESVAEKVSALLPFFDELLLHVSRPVRWDSDHVVILNDDLKELTSEIVRAKALSRVNIALDFFDAELNRVGAWAIGMRSTLKALLLALLEPVAKLREFEEDGNKFARLALLEEAKNLPFGDVWDYYCASMEAPNGAGMIDAVMSYEDEVLLKRG